MTKIKLLLIEDDEIVASTIERSLRGKEFQVFKTNSGVEGLKTARQIHPALVILDVVMPGMDGYTVCKEMRADPLLKDTPVLFLTAKIKGEDRIAGFNAGADDYLCKPFNIDELILRIRAILRRVKNQEKIILEAEVRLIVGEYILDTRSHELYTQHRGKLLLTPVQFNLIYHLMSHPGQVYPPARLLDEVWDYPSHAGSPDLVRVHIKNLREKIESDPSDPKFILTVPGYGYTIGTDGG